jgi:hypothetical protein
MPDVLAKQPGEVTLAPLVMALTGGLLLANLAVLGRTMAR